MRRSLLRAFLPLFALAAVVLPACGAVKSRITAPVSDSSRVSIANSVHGKARLANDLGAASGAMKLEAMTLRFSMTDAQQASLDQLLLDQQNPSSTRFHQWLTPDQYAAQFGLSADDLTKVTAWLTSEGFTITEVAKSGTFIRFNGTVAQAQTAFATSIHTLSLNGETHFANMTDAAVPAALAQVVGGITGLHDFRLKSRVRSHVVQAPLRAEFTSSISNAHYIAPGDLYTIYNETPLFNSSINGTGQIIAVMGQVDINLTDIAAFRAAAGLTANVPTIKVYGTDPGAPTCAVNCSPSQDDLSESSLDVEWSGATAPAATILFVNSKDVVNISLTNAIDNNLAPIVSISYGECESSWGTSEMNTLNQLMKQANAQGITVIAPAGDQGATDCDASDTSATQGLAVDFPASSPYATAMGGTMFNEGSATGATAYWNTNSASTVANAGSALSYIPEAVWNEDASGFAFSAGGGGVSAFFPKPTWQVGTGVPADASRDVPDISLNSAAGHDGYLYCVAGSCVNGTFRAANNTVTEGGGTSFAVPSFAGILALVEQKIGVRVGNANPTIYALANNATYNNSTTSSAFHDVTTGNNNNPCTGGTPNCPNGGTIGYSAAAGYDLATGWGTVNAYNLVFDWNLVTPVNVGTPSSGISSTVVTATPASVAAGASVTVTASLTGLQVTSQSPLVTAPGATPTGTVQFLVNNVTTGAPVALTNGVATFTYVTSCATLGQRILSASYSGDANYAGSKGDGITAAGAASVTPVEIQVTSGSCPDFTITPTSASITVTTGTPTVSVSLAPTNGFTGTVSVTASAIENTNFVPSLIFSSPSVTISSSAAVSTTLTLSGITAALHAPMLPGQAKSDIQLASERQTRTPWYAVGSGATLAGLLLLILPRKRRFVGLLLLALSIGIVGGATGCSSQKNTTITAPVGAADAGTYIVTITGTYTSTANVVTSHNTTVTFVVQ